MTQSQGPAGFDVNRLTTGQKVLLGGGILYLIVLFFPWFGAGGEVAEFAEGLGIDTSANGFAGLFGLMSGIFVIALLVWEGMVAAGSKVQLGTTSPALIGAVAGGLAAVFGILNVLVNMSVARVGAWIGILVALALLYGAYVRFQESKVGGAPPPPAA
jgi:hypothetical protein